MTQNTKDAGASLSDELASMTRMFHAACAEYAQTERIAMECAVEAVREALYQAQDAQTVKQPRVCNHNYVNGECKKCGCISAGE